MNDLIRHKHRWLVRKCKPPSTRWVTWRVRQKPKTGKVFPIWREAFIYAMCQSQCDRVTSLYAAKSGAAL